MELNFERDPSLRRLFVDGPNTKTTALLQSHFARELNEQTLLFLDEVQAAPEVFARLRYFYEESPHIPVVAAGSLLEFALAEIEHSVPVGRIEYLHLGPMRFSEYLLAQGEAALLDRIRQWDPTQPETAMPEIFHERLLGHARDFSLVGGMPEAVARFTGTRDFLGCESVQRSILETYQQDFAKFRKRIPLERLHRVFTAIPSQVGRKWVHSRVAPNEKARATEAALDALCMARVAHRVFHSSGNGAPLVAEQNDHYYKTLFLDVGLMSLQLGWKASELTETESFARVNEGALAEQWVGQHLADLRPMAESPRLHYWVREKKGSEAEVDYLFTHGPTVFPIKVKAGASSKAKSLQVFLAEKSKSPLVIHVSTAMAAWNPQLRILSLPFYLIEQLPRVVNRLHD